MMKNIANSSFIKESNASNMNLLDLNISSDDDTKQLVLPPLPKTRNNKRKT